MSETRLNILVVDDEEPMRILLRDFLSSQGYDVQCFSSALLVLQYLKKASGPLKDTAIVADVKMSPLDGISLTEEVVRAYPSLPVFLFTGCGNPVEKALALRKGAQSYLFKPFSLAELKQILDRKFPVYQNKKTTD